MSNLSRVAAPITDSEVARSVVSLFADPERAAPSDLFGSLGDELPGDEGAVPELELRRSVPALTGMGTSAARIARGYNFVPEPLADNDRTDARRPPAGPTGLGTSAARVWAGRSSDSGPDDAGPGPALFCPPAVRDNEGLGHMVNEGLVDWAEEVGVYPGQLDRLRSADFGRLIMLTHPATDDPDRLLAAGRCIVAEWATDDHFLDDESLGADPKEIGWRLAVTYGAVDPVDLPVQYAPHLDEALSREPVAVAYRSAFTHLARYATPTQVARLHHELAVMFMAYNHEANWRMSGRLPPVWEYLTHRHENSFLPPMVLVDPIAGYELPAYEFADPRVRRVFCLAGTASVVLNDIYSKAKESDEDFNLPKVIAAEEGCTQEEAIDRTVAIHNELMETFVAESLVLSSVGSPALRRFLTDIWAWLGGNREWHSTTERYHAASDA